MAIKHAFTSAKDDGADATLVRPSNWNAEHTGLTIVRKTADETVTYSTDFQDDDHLLLAVGINEVWDVFVCLKLIADNDTVKHKIRFTVPTNGVFNWYCHGDIGATGATTPLTLRTTGALSSIASTTTETALLIWGHYIGGDTAGNLQLQWCNAVYEDTAGKVLTNSYILAHKLA